MDKRALATGAALALVGSVMSVGPVAADLIAHPAHIHEGSCPEVGDIVGPLDDVVGEWMPTPIGFADLATYPVRASVTTAVPVPYADLFSTLHSLVVHQGPSDEDMAVYILCGNLSGSPLSATDIAVGLGEPNGSGHAGIATMHDNGDATVDVAVYMTTRDAWIGDVG